MSNGVEEAENQEESNEDSDIPSEARRHALDDARRVLDQELQSLNDITQKAWRVVQFNGLVATVFAKPRTHPIQSNSDNTTLRNPTRRGRDLTWIFHIQGLPNTATREYQYRPRNRYVSGGG